MSNARSNAARRMEKLGEQMRAATPPASLQQHLEGRARLIAAVEKMRKPSRAKPAFVAFAFAAAVAAAAVLFVRMRPGPAAIAWHVENGAASAQGYVSIPPTAPSARLVFDDGSDVALSPGSRGRVAATTPVGAEVVLEQGRAKVHVQHRDRTRWMVDAGPFAVRVTGTEFFVAWAADAETLDVWMKSGRVEVTGPVLGDALTLSEGQHLRARLHDKTVQIDGETEPPDPRRRPAQSTRRRHRRVDARRPRGRGDRPRARSGRRGTHLVQARRVGGLRPRRTRGRGRGRAARSRHAARSPISAPSATRPAIRATPPWPVAPTRRFAPASRRAATRAPRRSSSAASPRSKIIRAPTRCAGTIGTWRRRPAARSRATRWDERWCWCPSRKDVTRRGRWPRATCSSSRAARTRPPRAISRREAERGPDDDRHIVALAALATLTWAPTARAEGSRVVIVRDRSADAVVERAEVRLAAELRAAGFEVEERVVEGDDDARKAVEEPAGTGPFATVLLRRAGGRAATDVWVADHVTHKTVVRRVGSRGTGDAGDRSLALRVVELMRASLVEGIVLPPPEEEPVSPARRLPPAPPPPPPDVAAWTRGGRARAPRMRPVHVAIALGVAGAFAGPDVGMAVAPELRVAWHATPWWSVGVLAAGPGFGGRVTAAEGNASVRQELAARRGGLRAADAAARFSGFVALGAGAYHLEASGNATPPFTSGQEDAWAALLAGGVGVRVRLSGSGVPRRRRARALRVAAPCRALRVRAGRDRDAPGDARRPHDGGGPVKAARRRVAGRSLRRAPGSSPRAATSSRSPSGGSSDGRRRCRRPTVGDGPARGAAEAAPSGDALELLHAARAPSRSAPISAAETSPASSGSRPALATRSPSRACSRRTRRSTGGPGPRRRSRRTGRSRRTRRRPWAARCGPAAQALTAGTPAVSLMSPAGATSTIALDVESGGDVDTAGTVLVGGNVYANGNVTVQSGSLSVVGAVHVPAGDTANGVTSGGGVIQGPVQVDPPCDCSSPIPHRVHRRGSQDVQRRRRQSPSRRTASTTRRARSRCLAVSTTSTASTGPRDR